MKGENVGPNPETPPTYPPVELPRPLELGEFYCHRYKSFDTNFGAHVCKRKEKK